MGSNCIQKVYQVVLFDVIAQNGASAFPSSGEIKIEDIDGNLNGGVYDTYFNINLSEDAPGTADYLKAANPSVFTFASLSITETVLNGINVFPNPAKSSISIKGLEDDLERVELYSITGQKVMEKNTNIETIDVSGIQSGVYFVKIYTNKGNATIKLIKK